MRRLCLCLAMVAGTPSLAHPHIFVETGIEVFFDTDGRAKTLRISWTYDELISLTLVTERGLDPDFDGQLTPAETETLNGFDMRWQPGFQGDTYALLGAGPIDLGGPSDWTVSYEDGQITSTHLRHFTAPVELGGQDLVIQAYDPGYYTAYTVRDGSVTGRSDCLAETYEPDRAAADQILQDALAEYSGTEGAEADFPAVGSAYAEELRVTCTAE